MKFGKRRPIAELHLDDARELLVGSQEFLRMWASSDGPVTCFIDPRAIGADPFALGIALADCVAHGAKAYVHATGCTEADALERIWAGLDAERHAPTDTPTDLTDDHSGKGTLN
jgi:hypothetical protein